MDSNNTAIAITQGDSLKTNSIKNQKLTQIYQNSVISNFMVCFNGDIGRYNFDLFYKKNEYLQDIAF